MQGHRCNFSAGGKLYQVVCLAMVTLLDKFFSIIWNYSIIYQLRPRILAYKVRPIRILGPWPSYKRHCLADYHPVGHKARCGSVAEWLGCSLAVTSHGFESWLPAVGCNHGQVNTRASVTDQYNLVSANGWWYLVAGKVTAALASHWPRVRY